MKIFTFNRIITGMELGQAFTLYEGLPLRIYRFRVRVLHASFSNPQLEPYFGSVWLNDEFRLRFSLDDWINGSPYLGWNELDLRGIEMDRLVVYAERESGGTDWSTEGVIRIEVEIHGALDHGNA